MLKRLALICALLFPVQIRAFSLLGPMEPWMTPDVGFIYDRDFDVGGPRNLGEEFRWNIPIITYGFDAEFKAHFGETGIAAVEEVMAFLNNLPSDSLESVSTSTRRLDLTAQGRNLLELRSATLAAMLEQLGLANPVRYTWVLRTNTAPVNSTEESDWPNDYIVQRNFDPITFAPSPFVNGKRYSYQVNELSPDLYPFFTNGALIASSYYIGIGAIDGVAGALFDFGNFGSRLQRGEYFRFPIDSSIPILTRDDLGGLRYLYSPTNINMEPLLSDIEPATPNQTLVRTALRPGVQRIFFQRLDPGSQPTTVSFDDKFYLDSILTTQPVKRTLTQPDITFSTARYTSTGAQLPPYLRRDGPNFSQPGPGSGIFLPHVKITFYKLGDIQSDVYYADPPRNFYDEPSWGLFNGATVNPAILPNGPAHQTGRTLSLVHKSPNLEWTLRLITGVRYQIETSTNLTNWTPDKTITANPILFLTNSIPSSPYFLKITRSNP